MDYNDVYPPPATVNDVFDKLQTLETRIHYMEMSLKRIEALLKSEKNLGIK